MKALVKKKAERGLWLEDVDFPTFGDNDLLIKIEKTSICGSDVSIYEWKSWAPQMFPVPAIAGHEFAGRIVDKGKNVKTFHVGQRVSGEGHITCGKCYNCQTGRRVLCPHTIGVGIQRNGCFAEYFALPAENAFLIPDTISMEEASVFDPLGNAIHTALQFNPTNKDVLVTGAGPIGLMAVAILKQVGAYNVVITDFNDYRLSIAKKLGAHAINVQKDSLEKLMKSLHIEEGFDICLEMSGSPHALASLPQLASYGGALVLLGILPSNSPLDWQQVIFKMLTIKGIYGREIFRTWYQMKRMLEKGLNISSIITHRYPAEEFEKGFSTMLSGQCGKVILEWS